MTIFLAERVQDLLQSLNISSELTGEEPNYLVRVNRDHILNAIIPTNAMIQTSSPTSFVFTDKETQAYTSLYSFLNYYTSSRLTSVGRSDEWIMLDAIKEYCHTCTGTGQDSPPPEKYHGICPQCNGHGMV
jgi:hypothetical protein